MSILELGSLQLTLFAMMLIGALLKSACPTCASM